MSEKWPYPGMPPRNAALRRQFTVAEHARFKGVPLELIDGMGFTEGHQALGQSVAFEPVAWLFSVLAKALMDTSGRPASCGAHSWRRRAATSA